MIWYQASRNREKYAELYHAQFTIINDRFLQLNFNAVGQVYSISTYSLEFQVIFGCNVYI